MLAEVVLSSSPSSQLAAGFPRCHARPRMRDSNEIMPALVFKYENAHIEFLIAHTIGLKLFRDYSKWAGWIDSAPGTLHSAWLQLDVLCCTVRGYRTVLLVLVHAYSLASRSIEYVGLARVFLSMQ